MGLGFEHSLSFCLGRGFRGVFIRLTFVNFCLSLYASASPALAIVGSTLVSLMVAFLWSAILYPKLLSPLRHLPHAPGGSFFHGHLWRILAEPPGMPMREWINSIPNGGIIHMNTVFNQERLILTSPAALSEVLVSKSYDWEKPEQMRKGLGRILGTGVLLATGADHKMQRKNLSPAFSYRHVKCLYSTFWSKSCELVEILSNVIETSERVTGQAVNDGSTIPWAHWIGRLTLDIIGHAGMGYDFDALFNPDTDLNVAYRRVFNTAEDAGVVAFLETMENLVPISILGLLPLKRNLEIAAAANAVKMVSRRVIEEKTREMVSEGKFARQDILAVALQSGHFSPENLIDQVMTMLAAGHETTATATGWALVTLCQHHDIQARLRREIRAKLPPPRHKGSVITAETVDDLPYLHAFCNEVLRVYPPVPLSRRTCVRDTTIIGHHIPKGSDILLVPAAVNMSKRLWGDDALEFNPERWLGAGKANTGGARSNYSNLTFMHGPRSCLGQAFAKAEFVCLLAVLVGSFEISFAETNPTIEILPGFTWKLKGDLKLRTRIVRGW